MPLEHQSARVLLTAETLQVCFRSRNGAKLPFFRTSQTAGAEKYNNNARASGFELFFGVVCDEFAFAGPKRCRFAFTKGRIMPTTLGYKTWQYPA